MISIKLNEFDPLSKPTGLVTVCIMLVAYIDQFVTEIINYMSKFVDMR